MTALCLDAGAFIALERGDVTVSRVSRNGPTTGRASVDNFPRHCPDLAKRRSTGASGRLASRDRRPSPDVGAAKSAGVLCETARTSDVVDALVIVQAPTAATILTSDPDDLRHLANAAKKSAGSFSATIGSLLEGGANET